MDLLNREKNRLYAYETFKTFVFGLIGLFIPIYVVKSGYSIYHAFGYIIATSIISAALTPLLSTLNRNYGLKHSLAASYLLVLPALLILQTVAPAYTVIILAGILYSLGKTVHNLAMNIEFTEDTDEASREKESSYLFSFRGLARAAGPAVGGTVLAASGMGSLSALALAGVVLSLLPLLGGVENRTSRKFSFDPGQIREQEELIPIYLARGVQGAAAVSIFALFMFTEVGGSVNAGWARSLDNIGFVIAALAAGRVSTSRGLRKILVAGSLGSAAAYLFRAFITTPIQAFAVSVLGGITFQLYQIPLYSGISDKAEETSEVQLYGMRKVFTSTGSAATVFITALISQAVSTGLAFRSAFLLGGLSCLITMYYGLRLPNTSK